LKLLAQERGLKPKIFEDFAFSKSLHYNISTSQISSRCKMCVGFGPVELDGYGVCYNLHENLIYFTVSSLKTCPQTITINMANQIKKALLDMRSLLTSNFAKL